MKAPHPLGLVRRDEAPGNLAAGRSAVQPGFSPPFVSDPSKDIKNPPPGSPPGTKAGPIMLSPVIHNIFWLPPGQHFETAATAASDTAYENLMDRFAADVGGNDYYKVLTQYPGSNGTPANAASFGGSTIDATPYPHAGTTADPILDSDVVDSLNRGINAKKWTKDLNHIFFVYTARNIQECTAADHDYCTSGAKKTNFCAYHSSIGSDTIWAYQPQVCSYRAPNPSPNNDVEADAQIEVVSHELTEAVTDPLGNAWQGVTGGTSENGDLCNAKNGVTSSTGANVYLKSHPYTAQLQWSNAVHGCVTDLRNASVVPPTLTATLTGPPTARSLSSVAYDLKVSNGGDTAPATNVKATSIPSPGPSMGSTASLNDVAVHDLQQTTFSETVDPANNLPNGTKVTLCVRVNFTDQVDAAQPPVTACADTSLLNSLPVLQVPPDQTVAYHETLPPVTVSATDADAGDALTFTQTGLPANMTFTDNGNRTATVTGAPDVVPGTYPVTIRVSDGHNPPVAGSFNVIVTKAATTLAYTGDTKVANGTPARLAAALREHTGAGAPIANRPVKLTLGSGATAQTCTPATDPAGTAACTIPDVEQPLVGNGEVPVGATFAGDTYYLESSASATARLLYMTGHAVGAHLNVLGQVVDTADTGPVTTPSASTTHRSTASLTTLLTSLRAVTGDVTTTVAPGTSRASASATQVSVNVGFLSTLSVSGAEATSTTTCAGSTGSATVGRLQLGPVVVVTAPIDPRPNTVVNLGLTTITLNEQMLTTDAATGTRQLTVNAAHVRGLGIDVIIASATSDIHNC